MDERKLSDGTRAIYSLLSGMRRSLDRALPVRQRGLVGFSSESYQEFQLKLEHLRLAFQTVDAFQRNMDKKYLVSALQDMQSRLKLFREDENFDSLNRRMPVSLPIVSSQRSFTQRYSGILPEKGLTLERACDAIAHISDDIIGDIVDVSAEDQSRFSNIRSLIPPQSIAPVQFEVVNDKIVISQVKSSNDEKDNINIASAKEEVIRNGTTLIEELRRTNCDRRLLATFENLQRKLEADGNIVAVGIANIACDMIGASCAEELSNVISMMVKAHTRSVDMYASQFPDWRQFVETARLTQIEDSQISELHGKTLQIIHGLEAKPESVDQDIPKTLKVLNSLLKSGVPTPKKVAFALLRSVENLVSVMFTHSVDVLTQTAKKTKDSLSTRLSQAIVASFIIIAGNMIVPSTSPLAHLKEISWIRQAVELLEAQLKMAR